MKLPRERCCCFSGHRPDKLHLTEYELRGMLRGEIEAAIGEGYNVFITGMARGVDIYAAEEVLLAAGRNRSANVQLVCAYPYANSTESFSEPWRTRCRSIAARAAMHVNVCEQYNEECYHLRNEWMVSHSSRLIAVFNGTPGGTSSTLTRATAHGLTVRVLLIDS